MLPFTAHPAANRRECKMITAETERLILRIYRQEDLQDLYEYLSDQKWWNMNPISLCLLTIQKKISSCNRRSWKLLETLGFRKEACFRKNVYFWKDTFVYARLNGDT